MRRPVSAAVGLAALGALVVGVVPGSRSPGTSSVASADAAVYCVGAAKSEITPSPAMLQAGTLYLGGYGIGPVHPARSVLRPIYSRAIAIGVPDDGACPASPARDVVIAADDLQGHFIAYSQGPYGFSNMTSDLHTALGIPASNILIQSTHTHNGPDDLGIWGGVPDTFLQEVKDGTESAITTAVDGERLATVTWATADMTGFSGTFGPNTDATSTGDTTDYPIDNTLRVLQARSVSTGTVVATLLNYSSHATVYGPLDRVSPDWPGASATYLEGDQIADPGTGYPGSVAVVTVGAVGHTWPAGVPAGRGAAQPPPATDDNYPADSFGDAVAQQAMDALTTDSPGSAARSLTGSARVAGVSTSLTLANDNPVLLATFLPVPGYHVYRAYTPPYGAVDVLVTEAQMLRVGNLALMSGPGEPYPSVEFTMSKEIGADAVIPFGLADDQLGYIEEPGDYGGALQCSLTDEGFFTISPAFGDNLEAAQRSDAAALGFEVTDPGPLSDLGLGPVPPPTVCTQQQLQQGLANPGSLNPLG